MTGEPIRIKLADIPERTPHKAMLGDDPVILVRQGLLVRAYSGTCPHAGAPLEQGAICGERLVCPWHKAVFALRDGAVLEPPALAPLTRYEVRMVNGMVEVAGKTMPAPVTPPTTDAPDRIAVIGAGAAAAAAVALLRARETRARITVVGPESKPPYDRTVLSKMVIAGEMGPDAIDLLPDDAWTGNVEHVVGEVVRLDAAGHRIELADGTAIAFDRALVATGGVPRRPDLPGVELAGVHVLRTSADAAVLLADLKGAREVVLLGASFISLEVATGLRQRGIGATIVSGGATPLAHVFGDEIGTRIRQLHEEHGVVFRTGRIARFTGDGRVAAAVLEDGTTLPCNAVLLGTGVAPATGFVDGLKLEDGAVVVDRQLHAAHGVFAAGDIARFPYRDKPTRVEHWRLAQQHGWLAARNMLGDAADFDAVPFFWTAQHGHRIDVLGHAPEWDDIVVDGDLGSLDFIAYVMRDDTVAAAVSCKRDTAMARLTEAMRVELTLEGARAAASG